RRRAEGIADVGVQARRTLGAVLPEAVRLVMRDGCISVESAIEHLAALELRAAKSVGAGFQPQRRSGTGVGGWRYQVDRATQRGSAILQRTRAAIDFDALGRHYVGIDPFVQIIKPGQRQAVAQQTDAADVARRDAGTANRN